jgi:hypothetical protein
MKLRTLGPIVAVAALLLTGLLFVQSAALTPAVATDSNLFSEKVNLALRRTAHRLLAEAGDSTSRIPPVEHPQADVWLVRLEKSFDYDRLPVLLQESLEVHDIHQNYNVAVLNCVDGELQLGYNFADFAKDSVVPCGGRMSDAACRNLQVTFLADTPAASTWMWLGWLALAAGLGGALTWLVLRLRPQKRPIAAFESTSGAEQQAFGQSYLDLPNQTLVANGTRHDLTYREAKLLNLFVSHSNQLLERDFILQQVWADEGILVGRSVDVFVSRLRKLLRDDPSVQIVTVHGVGYRLQC